MDWCATLTKDASTVIAASSLAVAIFVGCFAIWQVFVQRAHNRLSVRPKMILHSESEQGFYQGANTGPAPVNAFTQRIFLRNVGIGSALISAFQVFLDRELFSTANQITTAASIRRLFGEPVVIKVQTFHPRSGYGIRAGDQILIAEIVVFAKSDEEVDRHKATLSRFDVRVDYESLYGDRDVLDSRVAG